MARWAQRAGRKPEEIKVLLVTKTFGPEVIMEAYQAGHRLFGENRVQEAAEKIPKLPKDITWHMVGHLQTNKVKRALELFHLIESVDRPKLVWEIAKRASEPVPCYLEINTSGEETKHGVKPEEAPRLLEEALNSGKLKVLGLMTVGPYPPEERRSRRAFALLRELRDQLEGEFGVRLPVLSMGMTDDFGCAILEGTTEIRVGRAVFGERI